MNKLTETEAQVLTKLAIQHIPNHIQDCPRCRKRYQQIIDHIIKQTGEEPRVQELIRKIAKHGNDSEV